jgi:type II secretory pathway component PulJ
MRGFTLIEIMVYFSLLALVIETLVSTIWLLELRARTVYQEASAIETGLLGEDMSSSTGYEI